MNQDPKNLAERCAIEEESGESVPEREFSFDEELDETESHEEPSSETDFQEAETKADTEDSRKETREEPTEAYDRDCEASRRDCAASRRDTGKKKEKKGLRKIERVFACLLAVAYMLIVLLFTFGIILFTDNEEPEETEVSVGERAVVEVPVRTDEEMTASQVYEQNAAATVGITTTITTTNFFGYETTSAAAGSGFFATEDGYILTCYHVVEDSDDISIATYDGGTYSAELVGYDENNDIAVLKADVENVQAVVFGDSDTLKVGDSVLAIGNPLGELTFSLTSGIVSALDRAVTVSESSTTMNLIQTDCAINSGNSGGALFNLYGEVIGITNAKYSGNGMDGTASIDNIGFAIPISQVLPIAESLIENGEYEKPYIGVSVSEITTEAAAATGLTSGALVQLVDEGGPAEKAGVLAGDVIVRLGEEEIESPDDLVFAVRKQTVGETVSLSVNREGEESVLNIVIGGKEQSGTDDSEASSQPSTHDDSSPKEDEQEPDERQEEPDDNYQEWEDFFSQFFDSEKDGDRDEEGGNKIEDFFGQFFSDEEDTDRRPYRMLRNPQGGGSVEQEPLQGRM